jgi:hypothetical protein
MFVFSAFALRIRVVSEMMVVQSLTTSKRFCALGACVTATFVVHLALVTFQVILAAERLRALIAHE